VNERVGSANPPILMSRANERISDAKEERADVMDATRYEMDQTRVLARQSAAAARLAQRQRQARRAAKANVTTEPATTLLAQLRQRFMSRVGATDEQFQLFLPRLMEHLRKSDPALAEKLAAELIRRASSYAVSSRRSR
jgi:hypothetical protein